MRRSGLLPAALAVVCLLGAPSAAQSSPAQLGLHVEPCTQGKTHVPALCGTYGVVDLLRD